MFRGLGFTISGLSHNVWISGLGFLVSGLGVRVSEFRVQGFGLRVPDLRFRA